MREQCKIQRADNSHLARMLFLSGQIKPQDNVNYYTEALNRVDIDVFILTCDSVDIGWCLLNWAAKYPLYARLNIPEIQDLNILPEFRRQGFATYLIQHCEHVARLKNVSHMGISFGLTADYGMAQRLYFKLGYQPDGAGIMSDRIPVAHGAQVKVDDDLTLMLLKPL